MTNEKTTKRALVSSALAVLMCMAMLIGTTFAWFTDTASTAVNKIQSGTLKVDIVDKDGASLDGQTLYFRDVNKSTNILWEPGATFNLDSFKIVNKGNLALKYKVIINGVDGDAKLLKAIDFTVKKGDANAVALEGWEGVLLPKGATSNDTAKEEVEETADITISGHMREDAGNEYQDKSIEGIGITVVATQYTYENDSKDNQYDKEAKYPVVDAADLKDTLNSLDDNAAIAVTGTVTEALTIEKPVTIHNLTATAPITVKSSGVTLNAANILSTAASTPAISADPSVKDITITNSVITANTGKAGTHTAVNLPVSGKVVFSGNTVSNDYNGIEFGLKVPTADGTVIENNDFVNIGNNAINIYQVADGATVTIKNNTISGKKGDFIPVRLSNANNMNGIFVIANNKVDTDNAWQNCFVMLEDYSKAGATQDFTKYTLNFSGNTVGTKCTYTVVYDDDGSPNRILTDTNQPTVTVK